jgi:predicted AAA+ superfamily ATPase
LVSTILKLGSKWSSEAFRRRSHPSGPGEEGRAPRGRSPKYYFYDTGAVAQAGLAPGAVFENAVACALQREVHLTEDFTGRKASLGFLRDKEKREVDFVVVIDRKPRELVEVKLTDDAFSRSLSYFRNVFPSARALQVVKTLSRPRDDAARTMRMVPATTYLAEVSFLDR